MVRIDALLIGENSVHPFEQKAPLIEAALGASVDVERSTDVAAFEALSAYDVVVDYLTDSTLTDGQLAGLRSFVTGGGGYLPIHCAADLTTYVDDGEFTSRDEPVPVLRELIGGHFLDHPAHSAFVVDVVDTEHPVTNGVANFEVFDEPYQVAYDEDRIHVLARMDHPHLDVAYPVVWVRESGDGRVCYCSLGHTDEALEHESFRRILHNAIRWVADR